SGAVSDEQIKKLGEQLGVQYVCVAEVSEIKGKEFLFQARVVDVETARVLRASSTHSKLESMREMVAAAQKVAREIVTGVMEEDFLKVVEHMNSDRAIAVLTEAIQKAPNEAAYYMARGRQYHGRQEHLKTIADYTEAIRLEPGNAEYRSKRGERYGWRGDYDKAIEDYTEAIRLEPNNVRYHYSRAGTYNDKKDYDKAIADYNEAIRLKPDDADYYFYRGKAYKEKGNHDKAVADFEMSLRINPNSWHADQAKGQINELKGGKK
ncbi:MAG: tetratricopeptide repeat protein, partial [Fibromonadaceae bacterium]|nr:tetratricopeptide repeat protein [Fibromonadaceae bacterium]